MKKRFSEEQTISAVKKLETGVPVKEVSREMGVTIQTLYHWKKSALVAWTWPTLDG